MKERKKEGGKEVFLRCQEVAVRPSSLLPSPSSKSSRRSSQKQLKDIALWPDWALLPTNKDAIRHPDLVTPNVQTSSRKEVQEKRFSLPAERGTYYRSAYKAKWRKEGRKAMEGGKDKKEQGTERSES